MFSFLYASLRGPARPRASALAGVSTDGTATVDLPGGKTGQSHVSDAPMGPTDSSTPGAAGASPTTSPTTSPGTGMFLVDGEGSATLP